MYKDEAELPLYKNHSTAWLLRNNGVEYDEGYHFDTGAMHVPIYSDPGEHVVPRMSPLNATLIHERRLGYTHGFSPQGESGGL